MKPLLLWIERGLLAVGLTLAVWVAGVLIEARYTRNLPVPPAPRATTLPGEGVDATRRPAVAPVPIGNWVARLDAPSIHLSATVLEGSDEGTLARAAGHIEDTAFPGQPGNIGIAGHRDTIFRPVRNLRAGALIDLTTPERLYRYRVSRTFIVNPEDVYVLDPGDLPMVTLVTCYPFEFIGYAPQRYIVQAVLVAEEVRTP